MTEQEVISIRDHFEALIEAKLTIVSTRIDGMERAVEKASTAIDRRMELANEFRQTLKDQTTEFVGRAEYQSHHKSLESRLSALENKQSEQRGSGQALYVMYLLLLAVGAGIGIWATVAAKVWR